MKKFLALLVVFLLAGLASPYVIGYRAESELRGFYARLLTNPDIDVHFTDYQRGWFTSSATLKVSFPQFNLDKETSEQVEFIFHHDLQHGPFLTQKGEPGFGLLDFSTRVEMPALLKKDLPDIDRAFNEAVKTDVRMAFDGSTDIQTIIEPFRIREATTIFEMKQANVTARLTASGEIHSKARWGGFSLSEPDTFGITIGSGQARFELQSVSTDSGESYGQFSGTTEASLEEVRISGRKIPGNIILSDLSFDTLSRVHDDLMTIDLNSRIAQLRLMSLSLSDFIFQQSVTNLDMSVLKAIEQLQQQHTDPTELNPALQELGLKLLSREPELQIRQLGVTTAQGIISSQMNIRIDANLFDISIPESILKAMVIDAQGSVPEAFVHAIGLIHMAKAMVEQGYLLRQADMLVFDLSLNNGQWTLFDKQVPISWPSG